MTPLRAIHWALAAVVLVELFNEAGANPWHRYLGYAAAALVAVRLAWELRAIRRAKAIALAMWTLVLLAGLTGWMLGLDAFWGEDGLQTVHAAIAYLLAACMAAHVATIARSHAQGTSLPKAMLTGEKAAATQR